MARRLNHKIGLPDVPSHKFQYIKYNNYLDAFRNIANPLKRLEAATRTCERLATGFMQPEISGGNCTLGG